MENRFTVSASPHIRAGITVQSIMRDVLIALAPAAIFGVIIFGIKALLLMLTAIITAVATEHFIIVKLRRQKSPITDLSAVVTGLLLAMNLPVNAPLWLAVIGSVFAIAIVKQVFGGIGHNFMNPALAARVMLIISFPTLMTNWSPNYDILAGVTPANNAVDVVSYATPLGIIAEGSTEQLPPLFSVIIGNIGGSIGETSALLLILGGIYLLYRGVINYRIPLTFMATSFIFSFMFSGFDAYLATYHLFIGGLMIGAIFMATDYASSPMTAKGQLLYGFGCGLITVLIRFFGALPEGVSYAIILMNVASPIIERYTAPKVFGGAK